MIALLCLIISSSALKLQQDPEFDVTNAVYDEECGNRNNYKCWKKGGHSLDKKSVPAPSSGSSPAKTTPKTTPTTTPAPPTTTPALAPKFDINVRWDGCDSSFFDRMEVNHRGQPVCDECYEWSYGGEVSYLMFKNTAGNQMWTWTSGTSAPTGCTSGGGVKHSSKSYVAGSGTCQVVQETDAKGASQLSGLEMTNYNFPNCRAGDTKTTPKTTPTTTPAPPTTTVATTSTPACSISHGEGKKCSTYEFYMRDWTLEMGRKDCQQKCRQNGAGCATTYTSFYGTPRCRCGGLPLEDGTEKDTWAASTCL